LQVRILPGAPAFAEASAGTPKIIRIFDKNFDSTIDAKAVRRSITCPAKQFVKTDAKAGLFSTTRIHIHLMAKLIEIFMCL
jgi:hypothetical protein